jgi:VanZ family protein
MKGLLLFLIILFPCYIFAQQDSSSLKNKEKLYLISGATAFYGLSVTGMNELWYKGYERSSFHWIDDSQEWLQIDKTGHFLSSYVSARLLFGGLRSVGLKENSSVLWASGIALAGISTIEVFDGFSAGWGASASDLLFNFTGVTLFATQSLMWKEEKLIPKISWHPTTYADFRPDILGKTFPERLLKDYNGHTLWFSFNLKSLTGAEYIPSWLCASIGYGAEGMISGYNDPSILPHFERYRQYYLSFDADFSKINTGSKTINLILKGLNFIKVPFPAVVFGNNETRFSVLYF